MTLTTLKSYATAAQESDHAESENWYNSDELIEGVDHTVDAEFLAQCTPKVILGLVEVALAAKRLELSRNPYHFGPLVKALEGIEP
jgi:hypothetical protein